MYALIFIGTQLTGQPNGLCPSSMRGRAYSSYVPRCKLAGPPRDMLNLAMCRELRSIMHQRSSRRLSDSIALCCLPQLA